MLKRLNNSYAIWLFLGDMLLTLFGLALARQVRLILPFGMQVDPSTLEPLGFALAPAFYGLVVVVWMAVFLILPVYDRRRSLRAIADLQITLIAIAFAVLILAGLAYFFFRELSRVLFVYFTAIDAILLVAWRTVLRAILRMHYAVRPARRRRVLIVGSGYIAEELAVRIQNYAWTGLDLVGFLSAMPATSASPISVTLPDTTGSGGPGAVPILGGLTDAERIVSQAHIDEVLVALPLHAHRELADLVLRLQSQPVSVRVVPDLFDLAFARTGIENLDGIPLVGLRDPALTPFQRAVKRAFDLVVGSLLLIILAIPMATIALLIKLGSPGPAIFKQQRVGEGGRLFWMIKFRSMIDQADRQLVDGVQQQPDGQIAFKSPDDPRVTRIGRWLRQFSLDELPQLLNVLKGEMSLVGPRPELPWLAERYAGWQRKRFVVPPGMTGWWQVNGRSDKPTPAKVRDDLYYIQNYSLLLDIVILWKTIGAVLKRRGAF
jgi:exopolysaccharide biosynthesis polyprenyl glycosylphosphotransferase